MAARDRNLVAWQAYVIVMSMVAVGFMIGLAISVTSHSNTERSKQDALSRASRAEDATRKLNTQIELLNGMLGQRQFTQDEWDAMKKLAAGDAQTATLQTQFEKDMSLFGANEPLQNRNYPKLTETLMRELRDRNLQIDSVNRSQADLVKKTEAAIKSETDARQKAEARADKLEKDLEIARAEFQKQLDAGQKTITEVSETLAKKIAEFTREKAILEAKAKEEKDRADKFVNLNVKLNRRIREVEGEEFQAAQGKIVDTAEGGKVVWINLGYADELRPGVKFGIIDPQDATRIMNAVPKAHLEISEILGPNLSRGRVISGNIQVPIIKNDLVSSALWQKGRKMQFALLGKMDMNGDGLDDRETLKAMIIQGGGIISEDLPPDGKATGEMTVDTNWLVVGESFKVSANEELDVRQRSFRENYAKMQIRAKELAVSQINLDKLLNWLQTSGQAERTVPLTGAGSTGNEPPRRVPSSSGTVSELYQEKQRAGAFGPPK